MAALLEVNGLKKYYPIQKGVFRRTVGYYKAVDGVSFSIEVGKTFGLVGESGCGKTTVGKAVLRLHEPTDGEILLEGRDVRLMDGRALRAESKNMQIIFQDPYGSLNPRMTVEDIISEPLKKHKMVSSAADCAKQVKALLNNVGLAEMDMRRYPHEFSGGQRQRIVIARALACKPKLIVCDEPVSALDVSVQAQILNLMKDLQMEYGIAYLFIAHGMPVVQHMSDRVGVMYLGKLVEVTDADNIYSGCLHPYSKALMSAVPKPDPQHISKRILIKGELPGLGSAPSGCLFSSRCPHCYPECVRTAPELREISPGHWTACHQIPETKG